MCSGLAEESNVECNERFLYINKFLYYPSVRRGKAREQRNLRNVRRCPCRPAVNLQYHFTQVGELGGHWLNVILDSISEG